MWDSGIGPCVVCATHADRDILGRCYNCFSVSAPVPYVYFKEMGRENPHDPKGSTAHVRDIKQRRLDPKTKEVFNYKGERSYFFPKGK